MKCYNPNFTYQREDNKKIIFISEEEWNKPRTHIITKEGKAVKIEYMKIKCGKCIDCKLLKAKEGALRIENEKKSFTKSYFITLTYTRRTVPLTKDQNGNIRTTLKISDLQKFWKRLRKGTEGEKVKYIACSEYGSKTGRPHYHAIIMLNKEFKDIREEEKLGKGIHTSKTLTKIGKLGIATIENATPETTEYVAKYTTKNSYRTKRYLGSQPEKLMMSKGMGKQGTTQNKERIFNSKNAWIYNDNGPAKPVIGPRYYLKQLTEQQQEALKEKGKKMPKEQETKQSRMTRKIRREKEQQQRKKV